MAINNNLLETKAFIEEFNKTWIEHRNNLLEAAKAGKIFSESIQSPKNYVDGLKKVVETHQKLAETQKKHSDVITEYDKRRKKEIETNIRWQKHLDKQFKKTKEGIKLSEKEREEMRLKKRNARELAKISSHLSTEYEKQSVKLLRLQRRYKHTALTQGESAKESKRLLKEVTKLDKALKKVDYNVGQFNRNVGNYPKSMGAVMNITKSLASVAGFTGGLFLFARGVGDAFNRVRQFDKSMQNLAGVMRKSRSDLKDVEKTIIDVAGSSIKTSREVANLAESLATLGKGKEEIKDLLEPVNNLSIGLEASSEEAGEFLVQVMNSFGASSDEASKYADTIATIRTSTTLDFQKMRDSFQYITPISKILNKDLAYTGALVGVLADNGLKAESAGRLLATAQQRLAKGGKTLVEALEEINEAQRQGKEDLEVLALANDLFGAQAAKVGVILANNSDELDKNSEAIRKNSGALDDLVNSQLDSLDAKLRILDSTWEKLLLSFEKGDGVLSKAFKNSIDFVNKLLEGITLLNKTTDEYNSGLADDIEEKTYKEVKKAYEGMSDDDKFLSLEQADLARDRIDSINEEIKLLKKRNSEIKGMADWGGAMGKTYDNNKERIEYLHQSLGYQKGVLKALEEVLVIEEKITDEKVKQQGGKTDAPNTPKGHKKVNVLDSNLTGKDMTVMSTKPIKDYIKSLEMLKEQYLPNTIEAKKLQEQIDALNKALKNQIDVTNELNDLQAKAEGAKTILKTREEEEEQLKRLKDATKAYLDSFSNGIFAEFGFQSLEVFATVEENGKTMFENLWEGADSVEQKFALVFNSVSSIVQDAVNAMQQKSNEYFNQQLEDLDVQKEVSMQYTLDGKEAKEEVERQYENKRKKILRDRAKSQKDFATFNAITNAAQAVVSTYANVPPPLNIPMAALIGGLALAQVSIIRSSEIPKFKDGTRNFKGGKAVLGDGGVHEYAVTPDGKVMKSADTDTIYDLPKGTDVYKDESDFLTYLNKQVTMKGLAPLRNSMLPSIDMPVNKTLSKNDVKQAFKEALKNVENTLEDNQRPNINIELKGGYLSPSQLRAMSTGEGYEV